MRVGGQAEGPQEKEDPRNPEAPVEGLEERNPAEVATRLAENGKTHAHPLPELRDPACGEECEQQCRNEGEDDDRPSDPRVPEQPEPVDRGQVRKDVGPGSTPVRSPSR